MTDMQYTVRDGQLVSLHDLSDLGFDKFAPQEHQTVSKEAQILWLATSRHGQG